MTSDHFQWRVARVSEEDLEARLNEFDTGWEVFSVAPTIVFGSKLMGAPVPSAIAYTVVLRKPETER